MIIGTCGFGSTGSSAVSDYLLEFGNNVQVLDQIEFSWVYGVDGLIDLDFHVNHPHSRTSDSINAISRYRKKTEKAVGLYESKGGVPRAVFEESVDNFLSKITQVQWHWYLSAPDGFIERLTHHMLLRLIPKVEKKIGRQVKWWPLKRVSLSVLPKDFDKAAKAHVNDLISAMGADFTKPIILDQPFAGNNPQACFKFFDDPYAIVVDRDPRDNYVFAKTKLVNGGITHYMPIDSVEDFVIYYRAIRDNQPYKEINNRVLSIQFEDMVYHYDETTKLIRDFLHLPENPNPKSIFDPSLSIANTQVWKRFPQFEDEIRYIEKELPEYLFDYTGCPEPSKNSEMFFGKSPKHA